MFRNFLDFRKKSQTLRRCNFAKCYIALLCEKVNRFGELKGTIIRQFSNFSSNCTVSFFFLSKSNSFVRLSSKSLRFFRLFWAAMRFFARMCSLFVLNERIWPIGGKLARKKNQSQNLWKMCVNDLLLALFPAIFSQKQKSSERKVNLTVNWQMKVIG